MAAPAMEHDPSRRRGVRRTLWVAGSIVVAIFLLSILSMLRIG